MIEDLIDISELWENLKKKTQRNNKSKNCVCKFTCFSMVQIYSYFFQIYKNIKYNAAYFHMPVYVMEHTIV